MFSVGWKWNVDENMLSFFFFSPDFKGLMAKGTPSRVLISVEFICTFFAVSEKLS